MTDARRPRIAHVVARRVESPDSGYAMRTWTLSSSLAAAGELTVVDAGPGTGSGARSGPRTVVLANGRSAACDRVRPDALAAWMAAHDVDCAVADEIAVASPLAAVTGVPRIVSCQNVESALSRALAQRGPAELRAEHGQRARVYGLLERTLLPRFDAVWVVSRADSEALAAAVPGLPVRVVPNVVPATAAIDRRPDPGHGVFFGSLWYEPNQDAVVELLEVSATLARLHVAHRFTVAGADAPPWLTDRMGRSSSVTAPGFVPDLPTLLAGASCAVFPMTYGGGSMVKLLTALGAGCPVVTTPEGARGIPELVDGVNAVIRPLGDGFVAAVADVLADPQRFAEQGRAGAALVAERYSVAALDAAVAAALPPLPGWS